MPIQIVILIIQRHMLVPIRYTLQSPTPIRSSFTLRLLPQSLQIVVCYLLQSGWVFQNVDWKWPLRALRRPCCLLWILLLIVSWTVIKIRHRRALLILRQPHQLLPPTLLIHIPLNRNWLQEIAALAASEHSLIIKPLRYSWGWFFAQPLYVV